MTSLLQGTKTITHTYTHSGNFSVSYYPSALRKLTQTQGEHANSINEAVDCVIAVRQHVCNIWVQQRLLKDCAQVGGEIYSLLL